MGGRCSILKRTRIYLLPLFLLTGLLYPVQVLEVRAEKGDRVLLRSSARSGDRFEFRYIHSVEKIPVIGIFSISSAGTIQGVETRFSSFGPGLPFMTGQVTRDHETMKASIEGEALEQFSFLVSPFTQQTVIFGDRVVQCAALPEGERVTVRIMRYPMWRVLIHHGR